MPFAGLDLHKKAVEAVLIDDTGQTLLRQRFPSTRQALERFATEHLANAQVAVEATFNTWAVVNVLQPLVKEIVVSNPMRTRAIAAAKIKTDRVDAMVLAQLLRLDFLPRVWIPDPETLSPRRLSTERGNPVGDRTRVKNRIHAVLHQRLIEPPKGDLFSPANLAWLRSLTDWIDPQGQDSLNRHLRQLSHTQSEITALEDQQCSHASQSPQVKLLMTLPGVDVRVAETLLSALGDISRFDAPERAASYLGLVPSTRQSGENCYHGKITKQGSSQARWLLVQAAQHMGAQPGPLGVFFRRLMKRKNRNVAVVATARKLVMIAWHMLTDNEPYRYAKPETAKAKLDRLRVRVTGIRKKGGYAKGSGRPANYGTGVSTRAVPSLDSVYADNALPPIAPLKPGEQAMLETNRVNAFARQIRVSKRKPRKSQAQSKE